MNTFEFQNVPFDGSVLAAMQYPNDPHLFVVLVCTDTDAGKYAIYLHNVLIGDYAHGQYLTMDTPVKNRKNAYNDFIKQALTVVNAFYFKEVAR